MTSKWLKIISWFFGTCLALFILIIFLILKSLPSPSEIGKHFNPPKAAPLSSTTMTITTTIAMNQQEQSDANSETVSKDGNYSLKDQRSQEIVQDLFEERRSLADVCKYLRNADRSKINGYELQQFVENFENSALTDEKDPVIQSLKPVLRLMFQLPAMKNLIEIAKADISLDQQKREFEKFLSYARLEPADVGYDPNYKSKLSIEFTSLNLRLRGGWIESLFKFKTTDKVIRNLASAFSSSSPYRTSQPIG